MDIQIHDSFVLLFGKIILALIMFATGVICLIIFYRAAEWQETLLALESECDIARDLLMTQATIVRSQLAGLQERLMNKQEKAEIEVIGNIIKQAMPVVSMFMQKETSLVKWGFAGVKLIRSAIAYFSSPEKN